MSEPFVGEIRMFAGNFAPRGWSFCDGQLLGVSQNDALFSLLGTIYGGDGRTTFGLPDLRGRVPIHAGDGPGLTPRAIGAKFGDEKVTLTSQQLASHTHTLYTRPDLDATQRNPQNNMLARGLADLYSSETDGPSPLDANATTHVGGSQSHTNLMPTICIHFIIALFGIYPSRH